MAGLGSFAGGLAGGIMMGQQFHRTRERDRREKEEYERQQGIRTAGKNTFGNVGQTREDGSVYGFQDAIGDFSGQVAQYDPGLAVTSHVQGEQLKTAGLARKGLERGERYAQAEEDVTTFLRNSMGMPDDQFYSAAAQFASRYGNDGKAFGIDQDPNGGFKAVMVSDGRVRSVPIQSRQQLEQMLMSYASPQAYRQSRELGLKEREVGAKEKTAGATEQWRRDQQPVLQAQADMYRQHAGLYQQMGDYYSRGGPGSGGGLRIPEADKIVLTSLQQQEKALNDQLAKIDPSFPESAGQGRAIQQQLVDVRGRLFDMLQRNGAIPAGTTRTQFLGLPDPLESARSIMAGAGNNEMRFRQMVEAFEKTYGDAPEAAQARNALDVFMQQQFYGRVRPQNQNAGLVRQFAQPFSGGHMTPEMGLRVRETAPYGIGKFN